MWILPVTKSWCIDVKMYLKVKKWTYTRIYYILNHDRGIWRVSTLIFFNFYYKNTNIVQWLSTILILLQLYSNLSRFLCSIYNNTQLTQSSIPSDYKLISIYSSCWLFLTKIRHSYYTRSNQWNSFTKRYHWIKCIKFHFYRTFYRSIISTIVN